MHEALHTLGATDKYGPDTQPSVPDGLGEPQLRPIYPQRFAELMGGRVAITAEFSEIPDSLLRQGRIGELTAREINWIQAANP